MKQIHKVSLEDNLYSYRLVSKARPNIIYVKHQGVSIDIYYETSDDNNPDDEMNEYEIIVAFPGQWIYNNYECVGHYEYNNLVYFLYMKKN